MRQKLKQSSKLRHFWETDYTNTWATTQAIGAAFTASITGLSNVLSSSQFKDILDTVSMPWWVPLVIATLAFVTWIMNKHDA